MTRRSASLPDYAKTVDNRGQRAAGCGELACCRAARHLSSGRMAWTQPSLPSEHGRTLSSGAEGDPRWARVKALFLDALEVSEAERSGFLADACGGDVDLQREVLSLLEN